MTTEKQNQWAMLLEDASQREIRQMAEWAIEHISDAQEAQALREQVDLHLWTLIYAQAS